MANTQYETTPQLRVMYALHQARRFRHHKDCRCRSYGGEYCNAADAMWTRALDRELEQMI